MAVVQEFVYRAVDPRGGAVVKGTIEAPSEAAVTGKLKAQGLTPARGDAQVEDRAQPRDQAAGRRRSTSRRKSLAVFSRQMAGLINAGLPLMRTLSILIEQTDDKKLQPALVQVQADVESGSSFSAALARHPQTFPPLMLSIVRVGETGGFLGGALVVDRRELPARSRAAEQDPRRGHLPDHRADHRDHRRARRW